MSETVDLLSWVDHLLYVTDRDPVVTVRGAGMYLWDSDGKSYVNPATTSYLRELRAVCDEHGVLLIFDEIQTGIGRTGAMFAYEHHGVEPDVITLGKGLGGGFPVAAMLCKERLNIFEKGEQGGTYTGQPLAAAVALAVIDEVIAKRLPENARERGAEIKAGLDRLAHRHPIRAIRGAGLLIAFDLAEPVAERIRGFCLRNGLLLNTPRDTMIRLMPPLIATTDDVEKMLHILDAALADAFG